MRRYKATSALPLDQYGEIREGIIVAAGGEEPDPLQQILQVETEMEYIKRTVKAVITLPHCQQRAMICVLKDRLEYIKINPW